MRTCAARLAYHRPMIILQEASLRSKNRPHPVGCASLAARVSKDYGNYPAGGCVEVTAQEYVVMLACLMLQASSRRVQYEIMFVHYKAILNKYVRDVASI